MIRVYPRDILFTVKHTTIFFEVPLLIKSPYTLLFAVQHNDLGEFQNLSYHQRPAPHEYAFSYKTDTIQSTNDPHNYDVSLK